MCHTHTHRRAYSAAEPHSFHLLRWLISSFFSVPCTRLYKQSIRTVISFLCERIECFWKIYRTLSAMCSRLASFLLCLTHTDTQSMRWTVRYISAVYGWACVCIGSRPFVAVPHSDRSPAFTTITTASITVVYGTETCYRAATTAMPSISVGQPRLASPRLALPITLYFTLHTEMYFRKPTKAMPHVQMRLAHKYTLGCSYMYLCNVSFCPTPKRGEAHLTC